MSRAANFRTLAKAANALAKAIEDSERAALVRNALGTDCTRARMTTANARWMRAAEDRDYKRRQFNEALERVGYHHLIAALDRVEAAA